MGSSVVFAARNAINAARKEEGLGDWLPVQLPLTAERIRMACADQLTRSVLEEESNFVAKGSF